MSNKTKAVFLSILTILKNATVIIPLIEGIIGTILSMYSKEEKNNGRDDGIGVSGVSSSGNA